MGNKHGSLSILFESRKRKGTRLEVNLLINNIILFPLIRFAQTIFKIYRDYNERTVFWGHFRISGLD